MHADREIIRRRVGPHQRARITERAPSTFPRKGGTGTKERTEKNLPGTNISYSTLPTNIYIYNNDTF